MTVKLEKGGSKMALQEDRIQLAMQMNRKKKTTGSSACEPTCLDIVRVSCSKHVVVAVAAVVAAGAVEVVIACRA